VRVEVPSTQGGAAYVVVMKLLQGLEEKGHSVVMDNFFCSIPLFQDLASKGIYATGTVRANRIGLPSHLKNMRIWRRYEQGHLEWARHKVEEPIPDTLRFRDTKESELDMKFFW
jgi:hypothetical protein